MTIALRISVIVLAVLFAIYVVRLIMRDRMRLRYSLLWFLLVIVVILCAIWPDPLFSFSEFLGFRAPANFIFLVGIALILAIVLSLSITVSWQSTYIRNLVQEVALLKDRLGIDDAHGAARAGEADGAAADVAGGTRTGADADETVVGE